MRVRRKDLLLVLLAFLVACGSSGGSPGPSAASASSADLQRYLLRLEDLPVGFQSVPAGSMAFPNQEVCRSQNQEASSQCLRRLEKWGRLDGYQVQFRREDALALLEKTFGVYNLVAGYKDQQGVAEALRYSRQALTTSTRQTEQQMTILESPRLGEEAVAYLRRATENINGREIALSYYWVDFRRQNLLVRVGTVGPAALASPEELLRYGRLLDQRVIDSQ